MSYSRIKSLVNEELKSYFRPEFLNRLDEIIVFRQLTKKEVKQIADIMLRDVFKRGEEKGLKIEVTEKFKDRCVCVRAREAGRAPLNDGSSGVWLVGRRGLQQSLRTCHCGAGSLQELTVMPVLSCVCMCCSCSCPVVVCCCCPQAGGRGLQPRLWCPPPAPRHHAPH